MSDAEKGPRVVRFPEAVRARRLPPRTNAPPATSPPIPVHARAQRLPEMVKTTLGQSETAHATTTTDSNLRKGEAKEREEAKATAATATLPTQCHVLQCSATRRIVPLPVVVVVVSESFATCVSAKKISSAN